MDYIVVRHEGVDTLHSFPTFEECNVDDAVEREHVDVATAASLLASGIARGCAHCEPRPEAPTLNTRGDAP